jgi:hypothetical protein
MPWTPCLISFDVSTLPLWNPTTAFPKIGVDWLHYVIVIIFALLGAACVLSVAISLPGTWIMLGLAVLIELLDGMYLSGPEPITAGLSPGTSEISITRHRLPATCAVLGPGSGGALLVKSSDLRGTLSALRPLQHAWSSADRKVRVDVDPVAAG